MSRLGAAHTARGLGRREGFAARGTRLRGATALMALAAMMAVVGLSAGRPAVARAAAPPGLGLHGHRRRPVVHPQADQDRRAACGHLHAGQPVRHRPLGRHPDADQIPDRLTSYGLRTVDGSCNNLFPGRETFAAADQPFPRLTTAEVPGRRGDRAGFPVGPSRADQLRAEAAATSSSTRSRASISNLIVDQTSTNPAAIAAAGFPVRTQGNPGLFPCTTDPDPTADPPVDGVPAGCVPSHQTLFIPNVTTDVGLSPPYNSLFTFFGQFFDHGVDQTVKSGGTVFVPLQGRRPAGHARPGRQGRHR